MVHPLKVTSTLADDTRFQIYEHMLQQKKPFTVQNIADQFNIHPNVARLHLTKLNEIEVITSDFMKTGKGGRPGRVYRATDEGVSLSFPKRDESTLLKWTLQLVQELGSEALGKCEEISYKDGYHQMQQLLKNEDKAHVDMPFNQKLQILSSGAALIGYIPTITDTPTGKKLIFSIYNCPFTAQLTENKKIVCALHESYLKGQIDALFLENEITKIESMVHQCDFCKYEINVTENN